VVLFLYWERAISIFFSVSTCFSGPKGVRKRSRYVSKSHSTLICADQLSACTEKAQIRMRVRKRFMLCKRGIFFYSTAIK
jgi:hypothetical protein